MRKVCHRAFLATACVLAVESWAQTAAWEEPRYFDVVVGGSLSNDSNLFKRPTPESDTISSGYVGLRMDKSYLQQRFHFNVTETTNRFDKNTQLNFNSLNYMGAWIWKLGTRMSGTISASRSETLAPFELTSGTQRNILISENRAINTDYWVSGPWYALAGFSQADQKSDQAIQTQPDFRSVSGNAGIRYVTPSGNSISALWRSTQGNYRNQFVVPVSVTNSDYREDQSELSAIWRLSGNSAVTGRLAWLERDNGDVTQHDFAGPSTNISYNWTPAGRLSVNVSANWATGALQDPSFSYTSTDTLSFAPTWRASDKTRLYFRLERSNLQYKGSGTVPATGPARRDTTYNTQVGVDWSPMRNVSLGARLQRQVGSSNTPGIEYDATIGSVNAALMF